MKPSLFFFIAAIATNACQATDEKPAVIDAKKLIGRWEFKAEPGKHKMVMEFRQDAVVKATLTIKGEAYSLVGKYRIDKNKVIIVLLDDMERDETYEVNELTDTRLVWIAVRDKEKQAATRIKDK